MSPFDRFLSASDIFCIKHRHLMSYLEVGEDMHKLASHVVDSVSWNPVFLVVPWGRCFKLLTTNERLDPKMMGFSRKVASPFNHRS